MDCQRRPFLPFDSLLEGHRIARVMCKRCRHAVDVDPVVLRCPRLYRALRCSKSGAERPAYRYAEKSPAQRTVYSAAQGTPPSAEVFEFESPSRPSALINRRQPGQAQPNAEQENAHREPLVNLLRLDLNIRKALDVGDPLAPRLLRKCLE
jgi:hypothetical protein